MNNTLHITPTGMLAIVVVCIAMAIGGFFFMPADFYPALPFGLAFPSPELWRIPSPWKEVANISSILLCTPCIYLINKHFSLLRTSLPFWAIFFMPLMCANLTLSGHFTSAALLLPVVLVMICALFLTYKLYNATQLMFFIATCISVGSMTQRAFLAMIPAVIISGLLLGALRWKELCAILLGLIAPYWVMAGFGLLTLQDFRLPHLVTIFDAGIPADWIPLLIWTGITCLTSLLLALYNGIILFAGNAQIRVYHNVINVFGITSVLAAIFDLENLAAYQGIFYLWVAMQFANLLTLRNLHRAQWVFWLIQIYILALTVILVCSRLTQIAA